MSCAFHPSLYPTWRLSTDLFFVLEPIRRSDMYEEYHCQTTQWWWRERPTSSNHDHDYDCPNPTDPDPDPRPSPDHITGNDRFRRS